MIAGAELLMENPMRKVRLVHWNQAEAAERAARLRALGYEVDCSPFNGPEALRRLRDDLPAAVVIDLSRIPSQGRDVGVVLRSTKATRRVLLVFVGGEAEKVERVRSLLPDAVYTVWDEVAEALGRSLAHPPESPVVPRSRMEAYAGAPLPKKLGIKPDSAVALISAPEAWEKALEGLPAGVTFVRKMTGRQDLTLWFLRSRKELDARIGRMPALIGGAGLWVLWPKKSSGSRSGLSQNVVRAAGLAAGLVDYKICSVDKTWSGLLFARRRVRSR
jgi:CheY-like chemotaxis protein